jgi:alcohol dehydrogenase YqhD (iron-dependent ADH family)
MNNFEFYNPTRILFGPNQLDAVGHQKFGKKAWDF